MDRVVGTFSLRYYLALTLFVAQVFADDHDATVPADDLALVADLLNAWVDLHGVPSRLI